jgi:hypothetical protein
MLADRVASRRPITQRRRRTPCTCSPNRLAPSPRHAPACTAALPAATLLLAHQHRRRPTRSYSPSSVVGRRAPARPTMHRPPAHPAASSAAVLLLARRHTVLLIAQQCRQPPRSSSIIASPCCPKQKKTHVLTIEMMPTRAKKKHHALT